jgi:hypothetical protein
MLPLYGEAPYGEAPSQDFMDDVPRIGRMRGPRKIAPNDLPDRVTFADVNDPKSVIEVDRNDLRASLGPNITWKRATMGSATKLKGRSSCRSAPSSKMEATTHEKYPARNHRGPTMIAMRPTEGRPAATSKWYEPNGKPVKAPMFSMANVITMQMINRASARLRTVGKSGLRQGASGEDCGQRLRKWCWIPRKSDRRDQDAGCCQPQHDLRHRARSTAAEIVWCHASHVRCDTLGEN